MTSLRQNTPIATLVAITLLGCSSDAAPDVADGMAPVVRADAAAADGRRVSRSDARTDSDDGRHDSGGADDGHVASDVLVEPDAARDAGGGHTADAGAMPDATHPVDAGHTSDAEHSGHSEAGDSDAGLDAAAADLVHALGACVGAKMPLTISGAMPYVDVAIGSEFGEFVLDFGSTFSSIDLSAFAAPGPTTSGCNASELGEECTVAGFDFFGSTFSVLLTTESYAGLGGSVRQAGIVGTDLLSEHVITLDYSGGAAYAASNAAACSASALGAAGFHALAVTGFYENDTSLLEAASKVATGAPSGESVPNVPTVPVKVAGVSAVAQLDTGFDDGLTLFSVNINPAFYNAIIAAMPGALVRDSAKDETLSTCVSGVSESGEAYRLATGVAFDFVGAGGTVRSYAQATLFVKETPTAAQSCGGIGTWTVPAAQAGASFYVDMKALVFDPYGANVWMPSQ